MTKVWYTSPRMSALDGHGLKYVLSYAPAAGDLVLEDNIHMAQTAKPVTIDFPNVDMNPDDILPTTNTPEWFVLGPWDPANPLTAKLTPGAWQIYGVETYAPMRLTTITIPAVKTPDRVVNNPPTTQTLESHYMEAWVLPEYVPAAGGNTALGAVNRFAGKPLSYFTSISSRTFDPREKGHAYWDQTPAGTGTIKAYTPPNSPNTTYPAGMLPGYNPRVLLYVKHPDGTITNDNRNWIKQNLLGRHADGFDPPALTPNAAYSPTYYNNARKPVAVGVFTGPLQANGELPEHIVRDSQLVPGSQITIPGTVVSQGQTYQGYAPDPTATPRHHLYGNGAELGLSGGLVLPRCSAKSTLPPVIIKTSTLVTITPRVQHAPDRTKRTVVICKRLTAPAGDRIIEKVATAPDTLTPAGASLTPYGSWLPQYATDAAADTKKIWTSGSQSSAPVTPPTSDVYVWDGSTWVETYNHLGIPTSGSWYNS